MARIDVYAVNSPLGSVIFDDGSLGTITNWVVPGGEFFETYQPDAISVVAFLSGPKIQKRWFAIALGEFEAVIH